MPNTVFSNQSQEEPVYLCLLLKQGCKTCSSLLFRQHLFLKAVLDEEKKLDH